MASAIANAPADEEVLRVTKAGRKLKYCLTVIQQPERARACGSGAKSSADRRPVDPPPVVELRIFDVTTNVQDVTFSYDANFFLFATLEVAWPIAHGRLPASAPQVPVLTGMPVSGMAYLDRPAEAGYFIFPDLSVRHEGRYTLSFNLYEETKDAKDADVAFPKDPSKLIPPGFLRSDADSSFDWKMGVKSHLFNVFSAKKFPGLAESTLLSKTVAEQGCRVRIRRDVRMRRREGKDTAALVETPQGAYVRAECASTPVGKRSHGPTEISDMYDDRELHAAQLRRISVDYGMQSYPAQACTPSTTSSHASSARSSQHSYGTSSNGRYSPAPAQRQPASQQAYNPDKYSHLGQYRQPPQPYGYADTSSRSRSATPNGASRHYHGRESEYGRPLLGGSFPIPHTERGAHHVHAANLGTSNLGLYHGYPPPNASPPPGLESPIHLPPIKDPESNPRAIHLPTSPLALVSGFANQDVALSRRDNGMRPRLQSQPTSKVWNQTIADPPYGGKRPYDSVFQPSTNLRPLRNGQRPSSDTGSGLNEESEEELSIQQRQMQYKRADGTRYARPMLPAFR